MQNRSGRSQNVSPPSMVPGASIRPAIGMPASFIQVSSTSGSAAAVGLARSERHRTGVGDQDGVEHVDEVRVVVELDVEHVHVRPEAGQRLDEGIVLAAGPRSRSTGPRKPVAGIVEGPSEGSGRAASRGPRAARWSCSGRRTGGPSSSPRQDSRGDRARSTLDGRCTDTPSSSRSAGSRRIGRRCRWSESGAAAPVAVVDVPAATVSIDLVGRSIGERVDERWARIREAWSQTVFFLFDAESWR